MKVLKIVSFSVGVLLCLGLCVSGFLILSSEKVYTINPTLVESNVYLGDDVVNNLSITEKYINFNGESNDLKETALNDFLLSEFYRSNKPNIEESIRGIIVRAPEGKSIKLNIVKHPIENINFKYIQLILCTLSLLVVGVVGVIYFSTSD